MTVCTNAWELTWQSPMTAISTSESENHGETEKTTTSTPANVGMASRTRRRRKPGKTGDYGRCSGPAIFTSVQRWPLKIVGTLKLRIQGCTA